MTHVCVFYVDDGRRWGEYIASMLKNKQYDIIVETFDVNQESTKSQSQSDGHKTALLKLLLVTPNFIDALGDRPPSLPDPNSHVNVTALLCSVDAIDLQKALPCSAWDILTVTPEDDSIRKIVEHVVRKFEEFEQASKNKRKTPVPKPRHRLPKQGSLDEGQLGRESEPTTEDAPPSKMSASASNVCIPKRTKYKVRLYPTRVSKPLRPVAITLSPVPTGPEAVEVKIQDQRYKLTKVNPYTYELEPPDLPAGKVQVHIYQGENKLNSCPLCYDDPDVTVFTYKHFLAQALGIPSNDTTALDQQLLDYFNLSSPGGDLSMIFSSMSAPKDANAVKSDKQLPTLLHFAAFNGLSEFSARLMELPGALLAYQTLNCHGDDPADLADKSSHTDLSDYLRNYVETKVTVDIIDDIYVKMEGHSLLYANLRPVVNNEIYSSIFPLHLPTEPVEDDIPEHVYLGNRPTALVPEYLPNEGRRCTLPPPNLTSVPVSLAPKATTLPRGICFGDEKPSPGSVGSKSLEELKQIQIMVAKGKFSVESSRKLFDAWKQRYTECPPSFKERQRALETLRETFRSTLDSAEESQKLLKKQSRFGSILERVRTTRQKDRAPPAQMIESRYVAYPIQEDAEPEEDDYIYVDPDATGNRISGASSHSTTSDGSRGSRTSVDSSGVGSTYEDDEGQVSGKLRGAMNRRQSRRLDSVKDLKGIDVLPPPPVPSRAGTGAGVRPNRAKLPLPPSPK